MKFYNIVFNPVVIIISFLLIIIRGEQTGGFYFTYLKRALPHGILYAVLAVIGVVILLLTAIKPIWKKSQFRSILNQAGGLLLLMSVYVFFAGNSSNYNISTFFQVVPLISIIIFFVLASGFIYINFVFSLRKQS